MKNEDPMKTEKRRPNEDRKKKTLFLLKITAVKKNK